MSQLHGRWRRTITVLLASMAAITLSHSVARCGRQFICLSVLAPSAHSTSNWQTKNSPRMVQLGNMPAQL